LCKINFAIEIALKLTSGTCVCMWSTRGRWGSRETRKSALVIRTKTARMISARTHSRTPTVCPKLVWLRIFIHPSAQGSPMFLSCICIAVAC